MKYYSEKLDKMFDSIEDLTQAEKSCKKSVKKASQERAEVQPSPTRKELAAEVEASDETLKQAYANYESAKVKAQELSKKYLNDINEIMNPAKEAVKEAEKNRYEAIRKFNEYYGAYQVTYTGSKAAEEMIKAVDSINSQAQRIFRDFFWL